MTRSQRHLIEIQGRSSGGDTTTVPAGGPTDITGTLAHTQAAAADVTVGTLGTTGGTAPYIYSLMTNPLNAYTIVAPNLLKTAVAGPHAAGGKPIVIRTQDAVFRTFVETMTITVT